MPDVPPLAFNSSLADKQRAYEQHFIRRARERFGIKLTPARYRHWSQKVEEVHDGTICVSKGEDLEHGPGRTCWLIRVAGAHIRVIYDEAAARLVTCFPFRDRMKAVRLPTKKLLRLHRQESWKRRGDARQKKRRLARGEKFKEAPTRPPEDACN